MKNAWLMVSALLLFGCAPSLEEVCESLADECAGVDPNACVDGGTEVLRRAIDARCEEAFDVYLDCVSEAECGWRKCDTERVDLEMCVGPFPDSQ